MPELRQYQRVQLGGGETYQELNRDSRRGGGLQVRSGEAAVQMLMSDEDDISFPDSPMEMASWVRDRAMKVVQDLSRVITFVRDGVEIPDDMQPSLHFPLSAALANAIKLAAFSSGHHLSADELSALVGAIYERGTEGYDELVVRFSSLDDPLVGHLEGSNHS